MTDRMFDGSRRSPIYWAAAALVFLVAMYGWEDGAAVPYGIIALLCVFQFFRPTVVGWGLVFA